MRKSMSAWIRRGSVILLTMLLLLTAAVAENAQIPILIDGVRVAFFDADGNLLTPCCPAPVSAMMRVLPIFLAKSA